MNDRYLNRRHLISAMAVVAALVLLGRLFHIQVVDDSYSRFAERNVVRYVTRYPARGMIYDRNGELMVYNQPAYDLMVIPAQTTEMDTAGLCDMLGITRESFISRMEAASSYSRLVPSLFVRQLSSETYAMLQETLFRFPGFFVQSRSLRDYSLPVAAHLVGYIGEVDRRTIEADEYYRPGDYYGISGIERSYEEALRGTKGVSVYMVDVHGRRSGSFRDGAIDSDPVPGKDIVTTIDLELQAYGELLMQNKRGSIVAIEPATGEILAMVTAPSYDPSLLVGRARSENFRSLQSDTLNPLFNRAIMAAYPPGSAFKPFVGLIAMHEGVITPDMRFECAPGYRFVGCHSHHLPQDLPGAIMSSCNAYFCQIFRRIIENSSFGSVSEAYSGWNQRLHSMGFGSRLTADLMNELPGFIPEPAYYDRFYGEGGWRALTIISLGIGQGEIMTTPLQLANGMASIANRGYYYRPHLVRAIDGEQPGELIAARVETGIDSLDYTHVIEGLSRVVHGGEGATARHIALPEIEICGKTGTVQNPHGENHSVFVAFAPRENPQIAIAVVIENAGFGSTYAAPAASLMIERYLTGTVTNRWREEHILNFSTLAADEEEY